MKIRHRKPANSLRFPSEFSGIFLKKIFETALARRQRGYGGPSGPFFARGPRRIYRITSNFRRRA